jgi:hypothetical protein
VQQRSVVQQRSKEARDDHEQRHDMLARDLRQLSDFEQRLLDSSFQPGITARRRGSVALLTVALATMGIWLLTASAPLWMLGTLFLLHVMLVSAERWVVTHYLDGYRSLVRTLLRRIEQLEHAPATPDNTLPTERPIERGREKQPLNRYRFGGGTRDEVDEAGWESFPASDPPAH